jgi:phosphatidylethanolamine-binding protein (PEBP) family uncharacterized protein
MSKYLEYSIGRLLTNSRGRDAKLFTRSSEFAEVPKSVTVTSPDLGKSPAHLEKKHSQFGSNDFPSLSWSCATDGEGHSVQEVQEWFLIVEDADAPLPLVPVHGMFYAILGTKTGVGPGDFHLDSVRATDANDSEGKFMSGGFRLGKNLRSTIYGGPRPVLGHGEHRYFYQVVALSQKLDVTKMSSVAKRDEILREMGGKILGWGEWIGIYENKL